MPIVFAVFFFAVGCVVGRYIFGFGSSGTFICGLALLAVFCFGIVEYVRFCGTRRGEDSSVNSKPS